MKKKKKRGSLHFHQNVSLIECKPGTARGQHMARENVKKSELRGGGQILNIVSWTLGISVKWAERKSFSD